MNFSKILLVVLAALLALGGCGRAAGPAGGAKNAPPPSGGWEAEAAAEGYEYDDGGGDYASSSEGDFGDGEAFGDADARGDSGGGSPQAAPASPSDEAMADVELESPAPAAEVRKRQTPPRSRPGLGTVWGENRASYVSNAVFYRDDPHRPFATLSIHYNDAEGVRAMAAHSRRSNWDDNVFPAAERQLSVRVLDGNYRALPGTRAGGRTYVVGEAGERYIVRVQNHTGNRVEVVATVDGLDVIDGRPGSFRKRGYILDPWSTLDIEGFRRSDRTVAAFRFGSVEDSYASRKGKGRNVGVIGVAFFAEAGSTWPWTEQEIRRRHDADPFPGRYADPPPRW